MKTFRVGGLVMSQQAFIILVAGTIGSGLLLISGQERITSVAALVLLAIVSYQAYLTNCVLVGNCTVLSWFLVIMNLLFLFHVVNSRKMLA